MTWPNVIALSVLVVVAGIIAYAGDVLGRRMGKRRLSVMGLRPRYTAIVVTTITGMIIAMLTMAIMATVSQRVKLLMLEGLQIVQKYEQVQRDYSDASRQLENERQLLDAARSEAGRAKEQRDALAAEVASRTASLKQVKEDLSRAHASLETAKKDLSTARGEIRTRRAEIERLEKKRKELERQTEGWQLGYTELREARIIFTPMEEIQRSVIDGSRPRSAVQADFTSLLKKASEKAISAGAKPGNNKLAVAFARKKIGDRIYEESEIIDTIVVQILSGQSDVVARIYSKTNSFRGEQAVIDCELVRNRRLYGAGEEIASTVVDGRQSQGHIFGALVQFLRKDVRDAAIARGVIPVVDDEGELSVGQIDSTDEFDRLLRLVDRIRETGRPAIVRATAARDTWAADSLDLNLSLGEAR